MMDLQDSQKIDILLNALEERYSALRTIRERVQNVGIWALGLFLGGAAWLIQSPIDLSVGQKALYTIGLSIAVALLRFEYLGDLEKGFKSQQIVTARLEKALGLFNSGVFDQEPDGIYPETWKKAGTGQSTGKFFQTTYLLLLLGSGFLLLAVLSK